MTDKRNHFYEKLRTILPARLAYKLTVLFVGR